MTFIRRLWSRTITLGVVCSRALVSQLAFGVAALVTDENGQVLLVRPRFGQGWNLPGGGVGAGEPPAHAILRELAEEVGFEGGGPPELFGLYTRRVGWATNVIAVYRVDGGTVRFKPNLEIVDIRWVDPAVPPAAIHQGAARRLAEFSGRAPMHTNW